MPALCKVACRKRGCLLWQEARKPNCESAMMNIFHQATLIFAIVISHCVKSASCLATLSGEQRQIFANTNQETRLTQLYLRMISRQPLDLTRRFRAVGR